MDIKLYDIEEEQPSNGFNFKKLFIIILCILIGITLIVVYCRYKATSGLNINEYKVTNSSLPDSFHGVKVVQFSDIYFGNTVNIKYLESIVSSINSLKPDIVLFTGDFSSNILEGDDLNSVTSILSSINPTIGKYAITGDVDNKEFFNSLFSSSGFILLDGKSVNAYYKDDSYISIGNVIDNPDLFNILMIHKPDEVESFGGFELALAGHSLNGQINIPLLKKLFLKDGAHKYYNGHYLVNNGDFYVSGGIGTTNFKYRFNNKPSINLYRLTKY